MTIYGYARVSTSDQSCLVQEQALRHAGCEIVRSEHRSGTSLSGRVELDTLLAFVRPGDSLYCTRIDRLARSVGDLQDIIRELQRKRVELRAIEQPIDTATPAGKAFLNVLAVFAEFETELRRERQLEGIRQAKLKGVYCGRKRAIDSTKVTALASEGIGATQIARTLGIGRASVYRLLAQRNGQAA